MDDTAGRRELLIGGLATTAIAAAPGLSNAAQPRFRIALTGDYEDMAARAAPWASLGPDVEVVAFNKPMTDPREIVRALRDFDAVLLIRERVPMPREVIEALPRLKLIVFSGGTNAMLAHRTTVDRNIMVANAPDENEVEGGPHELTLALLLACVWHIPQADRLIRSGGWSMQPAIPIKIPLAGRTLGIPGYGDVGGKVGKYAQALGMKVLGFSRTLTEEQARGLGVTKVDLDTCMRDADVVSVHLPLTNETRGMIGRRELGLMKPGAVFINTARGPIVDEAALIEGLRSRRIAMAGMDVYDREPLPQSHPFVQLPNVVLTPHIGYVSAGAMNTWYRQMFERVANYRRGTLQRYQPTARDMAV